MDINFITGVYMHIHDNYGLNGNFLLVTMRKIKLIFTMAPSLVGLSSSRHP